ncbi:MAG: tetratricopeptide repeat protein [Planctomycetes bacterium]|nr:tetratricopeptide repeat protein [Planctomycetota bacterium]
MLRRGFPRRCCDESKSASCCGYSGLSLPYAGPGVRGRPAANRKEGQANRGNQMTNDFVSRALRAMQDGNYEDAIAEFKEAIRINPDDAEAHYGLGVAYFKQGNRSAALDEYKILKDLDKDRANRLFGIIYE